MRGWGCIAARASGLAVGTCLTIVLLVVLMDRPAAAAAAPVPTGLCAGCHSTRNLARHPPVPTQDCVTCHAPHSADLAPRLVSPPPDRCRDCHFEYAPLHLQFRRLRETITTHKPVADGRCQNCHSLHGPGEQPVLKARPPDLCLDCHRKQSPPIAETGVHPPFRQGQCNACHAPHVGAAPALLAKPESELCITCHDKVATQQALPNQHSPFGRCTECHRGHQSAEPRLLKGAEKQLCYSCHKAKETQWSKKRYNHPPFLQGTCTTCHHPHASQEKNLVRFYPLQELCFQCHADKAERFATAQSRHPLGMIGKKTGAGPMYCVDCHQPHAGDNSKMRQRDGNMLCFGCHTWPKYFDTPHAEVEGRGGKGACTNCHNPHGTKNDFMLHLDPVTTCQQCHPRAPSLFQHPVGDRIDPDKGRQLTCASTCHNPHGTEYNKLLRKPKDALCLTCHQDRGTD